MTATDTNILVYAHRSEFPQHQNARLALMDLVNREEPWCIPFPCAHEFIAVVTNRKAFSAPSTRDEAVGQVLRWTQNGPAKLIAELDDHWQSFGMVTSGMEYLGGATHDARILAICESHRVKTLYSADRDFQRFTSSVKIVNPVIGTSL